VASFSVAQSSVPAFVQPDMQPDMGQIVSVSAGDCKKHSLKNLAVSQCSLAAASGIDNTSKASRAGEESTKLCLVHAITMESATSIEPVAEKQIPRLTRRLVALQPFSIKKPPRLIS